MITGTQKDVTTKVIISQELEIAHKKNSLILENLISGLVYIDTDFTVIWQNLKALNDTAKRRECQVGSKCYKYIYGRNTPCENCVIKKLQETGNRCTVTEFEENGTVLNITADFVKDDNQKTIGYICRLDDVTESYNHKIELERGREDLNLALEAGNVAAWIYEVETKMFKTLQGNALAGNGISMPNNQLILHPDDRQMQVDLFDSISRGEKKIASAVFRYKLPDGKYHHFESKMIAKYEKGKVAFITGTQKDITAQIEYQNELLRLKENAEESDKLKSAFLANMSHEIRTPLNAIVGFSELLQNTDDKKECAQYSSIINTNNDLLLRLINDILDLSKIESGLLELKPEEFDVSTLFPEVYKSLKVRCKNKAVKFVGINPYKKCIVNLDKNRILQVGTNFVTNAIKYTPSGSITMGYEYVDAGLCLYVKDTGIGISKHKQHLVFHRFAKLDDFAQGTGLGLAICKAIIDASGGKIGFESEEGKGSKFWAWIPCKAVIDNAPPALNLSELQAPEIEPHPIDLSKEKYSILVAEDNDFNFMLVRAILKNHNVTHAKNGIDAVELASKNKYDVILMDMKMPEMDGLEATHKIRSFDKQTPIVALTANAFDSDRLDAIKAGCDCFMVKPLKKQQLLDVITSYKRHLKKIKKTNFWKFPII